MGEFPAVFSVLLAAFFTFLAVRSAAALTPRGDAGGLQAAAGESFIVGSAVHPLLVPSRMVNVYDHLNNPFSIIHCGSGGILLSMTAFLRGRSGQCKILLEENKSPQCVFDSLPHVSGANRSAAVQMQGQTEPLHRRSNKRKSSD